jgi:quinol monooxygenase YgiN
MAFVVAATWVAREGEEDRVAEAIRQLAAGSRTEPGCRFYQPNRDPESPRKFFIYEIYDDPAAVDAHRDSEHFQQFGAGEAIPLLETRQLDFYETFE